MSTLERAIVIAPEAHAGQVDKTGAPYVLHPLRMIFAVSTIEEKIVAVLHGVCEEIMGTRLLRETWRRWVKGVAASIRLG